MKYGLGGLLFAAALTVSPAAAQSPGITDTSIRLGTQAPMSGVVAMIGMVAEGQKLKFDAVNAAGGVKMGDGKTRQVELVIMDDANEPPRTVTNARRMAEQNKVFAFVGSVGTPQNQAIKAYITQNKIPNIFIYSGIYEWGDSKQNPWGIGMVPSFTTEAAIYAKYLEEHKPNAKVAMLYLNTDFGNNFLEGFRAAIKGTNIELVAAQSNVQDFPRTHAFEPKLGPHESHRADLPRDVDPMARRRLVGAWGIGTDHGSNYTSVIAGCRLPSHVGQIKA